ncbi:uncharacterized protein HMPREF1541_02991 [Cyphellophora europaea CBS 101466]|uniref:Uncharacterized protein n=1 Tax=Cyphellophora europaea (strain CBS 101466) TaxID=1220924 RepID=W2RX23_CYPE1|nr:uncharacterized protein HMPREF1541_02991 [Cyphellophora europaea CBS 101466]ETN41056.1 hypothetical protein HMPREF1541_02991 [Cyphellophora europaea CBS 101466]
MCSPHQGRNRVSPLCRFGRLFEASDALDQIHAILNNTTEEDTIDVDELISAIQTSVNLQALLCEEIGDENQLYAGGLNLCQIGLLLTFEHGTKQPPAPDGSAHSSSEATTSLFTILSSLTDSVELFTLDIPTIDYNCLPPFVVFLAYKAAALATQRLWLDKDTNEGLRKLRILRKFLAVVGERWLSGSQ